MPDTREPHASLTWEQVDVATSGCELSSVVGQFQYFIVGLSVERARESLGAWRKPGVGAEV